MTRASKQAEYNELQGAAAGYLPAVDAPVPPAGGLRPVRHLQLQPAARLGSAPFYSWASATSLRLLQPDRGARFDGPSPDMAWFRSARSGMFRPPVTCPRKGSAAISTP